LNIYLKGFHFVVGAMEPEQQVAELVEVSFFRRPAIREVLIQAILIIPSFFLPLAFVREAGN